MGGKMSCCKHSSDERPRNQRRKNVVPSMHDSRLPVYTESLNSIQHISERDGNLDGDDRTDPSQYPKAKTIFMERSQENGHGHGYGYGKESGTSNGYGASDTSGSYATAVAAHNSSIGSSSSSSAAAAAKRRRQSQLYYQNHDQNQPSEPRSLKKSSSCSTIFLDDSTVSQPNLKNTVKCVSLAIYYHIKNRTSQRELPIFDERLHPLTRDNRLNGFVIDDYLNRNPEHKHIYKFIRVLFNSAQLTAECAIVTLIYLERLLTYAELDIAPSNWKRILLGAILLASKVWDDQAVWNVDYCHILKDVTVDDMNALEKEFLELLQFNINVPSSIYAKYYFDLRTLAEQNNLSFPSEPLSRERAQKLEAMSRVIENRLVNEIGLAASIKKWSSLDNLTCSARRSVAILS